MKTAAAMRSFTWGNMMNKDLWGGGWWGSNV